MIVVAAAALGLVSSAHCVAMCGPLVLLASGPPQGARLVPLARWGLYNFGRVTMYVCLGMVAGGVGHAAMSWGLGQAVAITGGVILILAALASAATRRRGAMAAKLMPIVAALSRAARAVAGRHPRLGLYGLGMANGLLPCGLVYAALALALTAGSTIEAAAAMAAFGAATTPALIATALAASAVRGEWRQRLGAALPLGIAAAGVLLLVRGFTASCH